jgi:two-component system cell cycle sensor histidine kinase/response regulator CckA
MTSLFKKSQRTISKDLTVGLILVVLLASTVSLLTAYRISSRKTRADLEVKADEYIAFIKDTLVLPIWNYDFETIDAVCQTYLQNELITGINVIDHRQHIRVDVQKKNMVPSVVRTVQLFHHDIPIGTVKISLTNSYLSKFNRQLFWSFAMTILVNLTMLLIMTGIMLRMALKRPLDRLNSIVNAYAAGQYHSFSKDVPHSELRPLVKTLDDMGKKIQLQISAIQQAEKKYRGIFENAIEGIYQTTPDGHVLSANPAFAQILGYPGPEALIQSIADIGAQHWVDPGRRKAFVTMIQKEKLITEFESRMHRRDGSVIWVSINARAVEDANGRLLHFEGMVQDISHRKVTEAQLRRLSTAVEQVADNIFITNDRCQIAYANPAFVNTTGYKKEELIDQNPAILAADSSESAVYAQIWESVSKGVGWTGLITNRRKKGEKYIVETTASPIKSKSERLLGYVAVNRDVTEKIRFEDQLRQSQKMEAIGTLAGGIAHDFNNILGVIIGCSELAMDNLAQDHPNRADLEKVLQSGLQAKDLVRQILTFSRQAEGALKPLILKPFIKEAVKFLQATLPATINLQMRIKAENTTVLADPTQIQQILMNLCTNAAHALQPAGGVIEITMEEVQLNAETASHLSDIKPGPYLNLSVRDSGCGIAPEIIHRIFDPFFTTKKVGEGTGLGLSMVHGIVKKHAGAVLVKSEPGTGTCFEILLPRLDHAGFTVTMDQGSEPPGGTERVVLVEDEPVLAEILQRILSGLGYQVKTFMDSQKALDYFEQAAAVGDLALVDHNMPGVTGIELIRGLRTRYPGLPVILYTGINEALLEQEAARVNVRQLLIKPLNRLQLAFAIRKVLDEQ